MSAELRAAVSMICGPPRSSPPPEASSAAKSSSSSSKLRDAWTSFSASKSSGRGTSPHTLEAWVTCSKQREIYRGRSLCEERLHPVLYMEGWRENKSWDRKWGHCDVFTSAIYYLLEAFSRVCMHIKVHDTSMGRARASFFTVQMSEEITAIWSCVFSKA